MSASSEILVIKLLRVASATRVTKRDHPEQNKIAVQIYRVAAEGAFEAQGCVT